MPEFRVSEALGARDGAGEVFSLAAFSGSVRLMSVDFADQIFSWSDVPWPERRKNQLQDELEFADNELRDLIDAMTAFRKRYCVYTPQGLMYRAETITEREALSDQEKAMQGDFQKLVRRRNALLSELASLTPDNR